MKYITLILLLVVFTSNANARYKKKYKEIVPWAAPTLSYRSYSEGSVNDIIGTRFDVGLLYRFNFSNKFYFGFGAAYSSMGYNNNSFIDEQTSEMFAVKHYFNFVELPLELNYILQKNNFHRLSIDLGVNGMLLIKQKNITINNAGNFPSYSYQDLRDLDRETMEVAIKVGATESFNINENLTAQISPFFKYGLLSLNNVNHFSVGVKLGIGFNLR